MNAYCDCGARATSRATCGNDPVCDRCRSLDGETTVDGALIVELASGDAGLAELASATGSPARQILRNLRRLKACGRVIEVRDDESGPKLYRLADPARGRRPVPPVEDAQLELPISMEWS